jgi:oligopeptide/dipeptide ABC transporter ATP-binding protein
VSGSKIALEVKDLRTTLFLREGPVDVVRGVSFQLKEGETLALVGESGCGKTMTALSVMRLLPDPPARITHGQVLLAGADVSAMPEHDMRSLRGETVSIVFQEPLTSLDPVFTIGDQIVEAITAHRKLQRGKAREMAVEILKEVQIPSPEQRLGDYPHQLSGGMRQRVMIAMALVLDPKVLIADEPTTALDVTIQAQILDLIRTEQEQRRLAVLLITHNLPVVSQVADRVAVMYSGEIVEEAPASEIFADPQHPYTQGLLSSIPSAASDRKHLYTIPGRVPDPRVLPPACLFAPRCPYALRRCWHEHPELEATGRADPDNGAPYGGHLLRCWNPQPFTALQAIEPREVDRRIATSE